MAEGERFALVTGGNRGLGFETCRQLGQAGFHVLLEARDSAKADMSKTALNAMTVTLAAELQGTRILVNCVCAGWVRTDMGGPSATRSLEAGTKGIVWAATLPADGPTGKFFRDGEELPW